MFFKFLPCSTAPPDLLLYFLAEGGPLEPPSPSPYHAPLSIGGLPLEADGVLHEGQRVRCLRSIS